MYLTKFMNKNSDWQAKLAVAPYFIETKQDGDYYILKYNMIQSDFNLPEVIEARGSIFRQNDAGEWFCVCRAMDKFGNYGESYASTNRIDWTLGVDVQEKIDGSIIKVWHDQNEWHISTNGTIDAFKAECGDTTFGAIFKFIVQQHISWNEFLSTLSPFYTYWFEMVSPMNRIVIHYDEAAIYFLGMRNMMDMKEDTGMGIEDFLFWNSSWVKRPRHFHYTSLAECIEAAHKMGVNEEGYVVTAYNQKENGSVLRIKVKGDEYLRLHKLRGNGALTVLRVVEMWQNDSLDDFIAYYPEFRSFVDEVIHQLRHLIEIADTAFATIMGYVNYNSNNRRTFARYACTYIGPLKSFLFARLDNKVQNAYDFYKGMRAKSLSAHLQTLVSKNAVGVNEDE